VVALLFLQTGIIQIIRAPDRPHHARFLHRPAAAPLSGTRPGKISRNEEEGVNC
jgi:hypothetical protein